MKPIAILPVIGLLAAAAAARAAPGFPAPEIVEWQLDNGLQVVYLGVHKAPIVSVQVWYHVGAKDEPRGLHGAAHMLDRLMFKGTRSVPPDQHARMIARLGGKTSAFAQEDLTAYVDTVPRGALDFAVRLEADRMRNLLIRKEAVDAEREVLKEERRARIDGSPVARALERFRRIAFTTHPYAWLAAGSVEELDRMKPSELQRFYDTYYRPGNAVLVVVGDVGVDEVRAAATRWFGPLERGAEPPRPAAALAEPKQTAKRRENVGSSQLGVVVAGYHIPAARSEDTFPLQVLANVLAGGEGARLYQRVVRRDQAGVYAGGQTLLLEDPGLLVAFGVFVKPEQAAAVLAGLEDEIGRLGAEPVGDAELVRARNQLSSGFVLGLETVEGLAAQIGTSRIVTGDARSWISDYEKYQAVTAADVMRVAKAYLTADNATLVVVPPGGKP
jgi:zinc protease